MRKFLPALLIGSSLLSSSLLTDSALAQVSASQMADRLDRIERDLSYIQRQYYKEGAPASSGSSAPSYSGDTSGLARLEVKITALEEQMRDLTGKVEEADFANRKLAKDLENLQKDIEFRFQQMQSQLHLGVKKRL